jgi:C-terminal processing protease CtpA/Prc
MPNRIDSELQSIYKRWLKNANPAVKQQLIRSRPVSRFTEDVNRGHRLSRQQRLRIVDQALVLLEQTYVHLPLKRAIHGIDPIQRLRVLRFRIAERSQADLSEIEFHREMQAVFASIRDRHTQYLLPTPFDGQVAYLPFLVEEYSEKNNRGVSEQRFMVSHIAEGFRHATFRRGVDLLYWNGVPIKRAIENNGEMQAGSNAEAQLARGLDALTIRDLKFSLPPDEEWVVITYRSNNTDEEIKLQWLVVPVTAGSRRRRKSGVGRATKLAIDRHKASINQMRKILCAPKVIAKEKELAAYKKKNKKWKRIAPPKRYALKTSLPSMFFAKRVWRGDLGYLRVFTFDPDIEGVGPDEIVNEFVRLVGELPADGLIIDVRGNPGGFINAGERLLQLFTPRSIEPELFEFINTPLTLEICRAAPRDEEMTQFARSISESVVTSATYSKGFHLTSREDCNSIGQKYYGPVVLITDALCYSTSDMFTAGFQDNKVGKVLGTSGNTGAGGANVYEHDDLLKWLRKNPKSRFKPLPRGAGMRVALRRSLRVGTSSGRPLEALGVAPNVQHFMTRRDLSNNGDLIDEAAELLSKLPRRKLYVERTVNRDRSRSIKITTQNIDRLDIHVDARPREPSSVAHDRRSNTEEYTVEIARGRKVELALEGFNRRNKLVATSRQNV